MRGFTGEQVRAWNRLHEDSVKPENAPARSYYDAVKVGEFPALLEHIADLDAETAVLRKENAHLENILGHRDDYIKRIGEQRRAAAHVINTIDRQLSTLGISQRKAIDNALKLIRRWRDEEPPRTNFDALTESPEKLAEVLIKHDFDGYCPELPECVDGIEDGDYPIDECKQCLMDWLNRAVDEDEKATCTTTHTPCTRCKPGPCDARRTDPRTRRAEDMELGRSGE